MTLADFEVKDIDGKIFDWSIVKGKKILIVNTASECGYTRHYEGLENLYQQYKDRNFVVLAFPCNDFGGQEPGSDAEIALFCERNYQTTFPLFSKITILGEDAHPLYCWLTEETNSEVAWNFQKYLINEQGQVDRMLAHRVEPNDQIILDWIES